MNILHWNQTAWSDPTIGTCVLFAQCCTWIQGGSRGGVKIHNKLVHLENQHLRQTRKIVIGVFGYSRTIDVLLLARDPLPRQLYPMILRQLLLIQNIVIYDWHDQRISQAFTCTRKNTSSSYSLVRKSLFLLMYFDWQANKWSGRERTKYFTTCFIKFAEFTVFQNWLELICSHLVTLCIGPSLEDSEVGLTNKNLLSNENGIYFAERFWSQVVWAEAWVTRVYYDEQEKDSFLNSCLWVRR